MKKTLFLLLCTVHFYGQTSTGQEQEFDYGIKNNSLQTITTPTYIGTFGTDGTQGKIPSAYIAKTAAVQDSLNKKLNLPTGFLQGLQLSINADPTKFNIAAGTYVVTDFTNLTQPVVKIINYAGATGLTPAYLATANSTYIALDKNQNVISSASPFTDAQRRTLAIIGNVVHSNRTNINIVNEIKAPIVAVGNQLHDFMKAIGFLNESGNVYSANGANLQINKSVGDIFGMGINASDYLSPHKLTVPAQTALTFAYRLQTGTQLADTQSINPNIYDVGGVSTAIPGGSWWTIQRINLFQSGLTRIQPGQTLYTTFNSAVTNLPTEPFVTEQNIADNAVFRCYLIVEKGTTDLAAAVAAGTARFVPVDKFGNVINSGSVPVTDENIIAALGYTPENIANKSDSYTASSSTTYASTKALVDGLGSIVVNAKSFGAIGNGSTDDTAALQAAINFAQSEKLSLYIPSGHYKITSTLSITNELKVYGDGKESSVINLHTNVSGTYAMSIIVPDNSSIIGLDIGFIGFRCDYGTEIGSAVYINTGTTNSAVSQSSVHDIFIRNVEKGIFMDGVVYMSEFDKITISGSVSLYGLHMPNTMGGQVIYNSFNDIEVTGVEDTAYAYYSLGASCHYKNLTCDGVSYFGGAYSTIDGFTCEGIFTTTPVSTNVIYLNQIQSLANVSIINVPNSKCTVGINALTTSTEIKNVRFPDYGVGNQPNTPILWQSGGTGTLSNVRMDRTCVTNLETAMGDAELVGFVISDCSTITNRGSFSTYSPTLLGIPTVPTASPGTNTDQAASTDFVTSGLATKQNILTNPITGTGSFYLAKFTGDGTIGDSNIFNDGSSDGVFAFTNPSANIKRISLGNAAWSAGIQSNAGAIQLLVAETTIGMNISDSGIVTIPAIPATSSGTYDILTRNTSTGVIEKIANNKITPTDLIIANTSTSVIANLDSNASYLAHITYLSDKTRFKSVIIGVGQEGGSIQGALTIINDLAGSNFSLSISGGNLSITNSSGASQTFKIVLNKIGF